MSRTLQKSVVVQTAGVTGADLDPVSIATAALAQGGVRVLFEDNEKRPNTPEELLAFLDKDIPAAGQVRAHFTAQAGDALTRCKGFLDAVEADIRASATAFKNRRTR